MGMVATTTNLTYARNDYIKQGRSHIFDRVGDMIYYTLTNNDIAETRTNTLTLTDTKLVIGSRTSGSAVDLGSYETACLVTAQYTDSATLTNTTDYVGCSAIFDLKLGRAITLASGGGYGFATIWVNLEVDKAINATGGQSAGWFTIWADAAGADAVITGSSRLQVMDLALVTGAAFNAGASTKIYGLRIDSSANASATMSGEFAAINIEAAGTKKDWTIGIDVNNCATGMDIGVCTTNGLVINESDLVVGSRTAGSAVDLGTFETGALIAAQYTDAAALINTTDYVGCAAIVDLKLGRAITLASGGGYGFASLWANLEVDKAINATGGQSTAWMTIWADAAGDDAHIRGTSRLQVLDLAVVTGADFDLGSTAFLYGLRIDSSVNAGATVDGAFRAINIEAAGAKYDWKHGIYISGCTDSIYVATADSAGTGSGIYSLTTLTSTTAAAHRAISGTVTYTPATAGSGGSVPIGVAGKVTLSAGCTSTLYMWGIQGQLDFADTAVLNGSQVAAVRAVMTNTGNQTWTGGNIAGIYVDNLIDDDITGVDSNIMRLANHGGGIDSMISFYCEAATANMFRFENNMGIFTEITGGGVHGGTIQRIKCDFAGTTYYLIMSTAPTT